MEKEYRIKLLKEAMVMLSLGNLLTPNLKERTYWFELVKTGETFTIEQAEKELKRLENK